MRLTNIEDWDCAERTGNHLNSYLPPKHYKYGQAHSLITHLQFLKHVIKFAVPRNRRIRMCRSFTIFSLKESYCLFKILFKTTDQMEIQFLFLHESQWKNSNLSAWFHIYCSTHVVVVDDRDVASMKWKAWDAWILTSWLFSSCWDEVMATCARSWQSWVFFWAGWLVLNGQVRIASNEMAKNADHVFLLLKWGPGIVRLDWSSWFMSSYYLDLPCFNIVVR